MKLVYVILHIGIFRGVGIRIKIIRNIQENVLTSPFPKGKGHIPEATIEACLFLGLLEETDFLC